MPPAPDFGVSQELKLVEKRIDEAIQSEEPLLTEIARHVVGAGGKRIRPTVAVLANRAVGGKNADRVISLAVGLELIHSATLLHDDINDGGLRRRGVPAAYRKYGIQNAIVAGDFLFVKAFALGGKEDEDIVDLTARVCASLAEAEIVQRRNAADLTMTRERYLDVVKRKTALPLSAAARIGALLGKATAAEADALTSYGLNLGIAFQIVDDILDVVGDPRVIGKPVGTDLREGNVTLLTLHAMNDGTARRTELRKIIKRRRKTEEMVERGLALLGDAVVVDKAREDAQHFGRLAKDALKEIRPSEARDRLSALVDFVVTRDA